MLEGIAEDMPTEFSPEPSVQLGDPEWTDEAETKELTNVEQKETHC